MEIKTDALFKKEIKKSIEYALQEFGLKLLVSGKHYIRKLSVHWNLCPSVIL